MGICEILTIIFVIAKLMGVINWPWIIVLLPEIVAILFYFGILGFHLYLLLKEEKKFNDMF